MFNNKGGISFIFILVGIISVFYCIKRIYEGDFLLINFSDCGLFVSVFDGKYFYNICRIIFDLYRIKKNGFKRNGESEGIVYI